MPVVIENNSSDPVDYDVSIEGGGGGNMMAGGTGQECASACRLRFFLASKATMSYEPSEDGSSRHMFLIHPSSGEMTFIELRNVTVSKTQTTVVALEEETSGNGTFYRIKTS